jgi:hypothetical protein
MECPLVDPRWIIISLRTPALKHGLGWAVLTTRGFHDLVEHPFLKYTQSPGGSSHGTALHSASVPGHLRVVRSLLRLGVSIRDYANERHCNLHHNQVIVPLFNALSTRGLMWIRIRRMRITTLR